VNVIDKAADRVEVDAFSFRIVSYVLKDGRPDIFGQHWFAILCRPHEMDPNSNKWHTWKYSAKAFVL
jgi:hypothetical protein